ncbi:hypothetical protein [uncultured Polaribacter sp.]|uniref:hypothetical protein n=1 Tax=uncultured Polaribacter sp. TaxID=174711 RepID=UPI00262BC016|nr:hypothetical protein [uncultured Polaribacter sp.]
MKLFLKIILLQPKQYHFHVKNIYNYYAAGTDLGIPLTGKVSLEFLNEIEYMINHKYVITPKHITDSYSENKNTSKTVDFILHNLK